MSLSSGTRLGPYEVIGLIGSGGMGEVYRARDTKLGRDIALKVLPDLFADDTDRLARFQREARVLASLNHPNIAQIHGLEEARGVTALILELVEGPTLADRIAEGPIPPDEALPIAKQIAEALEAAQEKGVVHRDLKPANIKITPTGRVKVLDFGLAKIFTTEVSEDERSDASTITFEGTQAGVVLGTAAYMSPEQARGTVVDRRTDIWAFGCCLYEALTGKAAFRGETVFDTIAAVLEHEPNWQALPSSTPPRVRDLLRRCLQKDRSQRLHDIADARIEIDESLATPSTTRRAPLGLARGPRRVALLWGTTGLVLLVASVFTYRLLERAPSVPRLANPTQMTAAIGLEDYPAWSADGRTLAYESKQTGNWDIWVTQTVGGGSVNRTADHAGADRYPSWSPNGGQIAFWSDRDGGGYFVMAGLGGTPAKLASTPGTIAFYHSAPEWSADGTELAYVNYESGGSAFEASLEIISPVTRERRRLQLPGTQEARLDLSWSRDGRYVAYVDAAQQPAETTQLFVLGLSDGASVPVTDARANVRSPRWSPDGRALYFVANRVGASDLWRQRMDSEGEPVGEPQQVTAGLEILHAGFSPDGKRVAYSKGRWVSNVWRVPILEDRPATWADAEQMTFEQAFIEFVDVSRDGRQLLFSSDRTGNQDLWRMSVGGGEAIQLTSDPAPEWCPRWSPDGREIAFYSYRSGDREIWVMPAEGGPARQLTSSDGLDAIPEWSPDGREISFRSERRGSSDVWVMSSDGSDLRLLTPDATADYAGTWSPDGQWVAYFSNRGGPNQIWRVPAAGGDPELLTRVAGQGPRWSPDGTQIFFVGADDGAGNLWSVSLKDGSERPVTDLAGRRGTPGNQPPATDGEYLYFTWRDDVGDIWVMDVVQQ